jgi:hypothetical protein
VAKERLMHVRAALLTASVAFVVLAACSPVAW